MKSPTTGKPMPVGVRREPLRFKDEIFTVWYVFYYCEDSEEIYTGEALDTLNLYQVYQQHAAKHNLPIEEVMPKNG